MQAADELTRLYDISNFQLAVCYLLELVYPKERVCFAGQQGQQLGPQEKERDCQERSTENLKKDRK